MEIQGWQIGFVATVIITVAFFSIWQGNPLHLPMGLARLIYFPTAIFWATWSAAAIVCPACGVRIGWYQARHGTGGPRPRNSLV